MATDTVSRVIPFPGCDYSSEGGLENLCPRRRDVTEPAKILQFPDYPKILAELERIEKQVEKLNKPRRFSWEEMENLFRSNGLDFYSFGKLLCCWCVGRPDFIFKRNSRDHLNRRLYNRFMFSNGRLVLHDEATMVGRARSIYEKSEMQFAPFE